MLLTITNFRGKASWFLLLIGITLSHGVYPETITAEPFFSLESDYQRVLVTDVLAADRIVLDKGEVIRLIGLKAPPPPKRPELKTDEFNIVIRESSPLISVEQRALAFARDLMEKKYVRLEFDSQKKGENADTLAYVFLSDGTMANAEILREGYGDLMIEQPNVKYAEKLREAYQEARREKRGLQGD